MSIIKEYIKTRWLEILILLIAVVILVGNIATSITQYQRIQSEKNEVSIKRNNKEIQLLNYIENMLKANTQLVIAKQEQNALLIKNLEKTYKESSGQTQKEIIKYYEIKEKKKAYTADDDVELMRLLKEYESKIYK